MTISELEAKTSSASSDGQSDGQEFSNSGGVRLLARTNRAAFEIERNLVLDRMFGEKSPGRSVIGPKRLRVAPELVEEFSVFDPRSVPKLVVDVSWQNEQRQAADFACWFTGRSSAPDDFVIALSNSENYLRAAIAKQISRAPKRKLEAEIRAVRKAAARILRFLNKAPPSHKPKVDESDKRRRAVGLLRRLRADVELLQCLFRDEITRFECDDVQFDARLMWVANDTCHPPEDLTAGLPHPDGHRCVADLNRIEGLAKSYLSKKLDGKGRPEKIRVTAVSSNKRKSWTAELLCAATVLAAAQWRDQFVVFPCKVWEACEEFWIAAGGSRHDDPCEAWAGPINAANRSAGYVRRRVEQSFGLAPRSFDEPIPLPRKCAKSRSRASRSPKGALVTLGEARTYINDLAESERTAKHWQDAESALDLVTTDDMLRPSRLNHSQRASRFARSRLVRALKNKAGDPARSWYTHSSSESAAEWVGAEKKRLLERLYAGHVGSIAEFARELNLKTTFAERLLRELQEEKLWPLPQPAVPQNM